MACHRTPRPAELEEALAERRRLEARVAELADAVPPETPEARIPPRRRDQGEGEAATESGPAQRTSNSA